MKTYYSVVLGTLFLLHSFAGYAGNPLNNTGQDGSVSASEQENKVIQLTQDDFIDKIFDFKNSKEWKYKGNKPAIIDFYAEWCGPCKMLAPVLSELQNEYREKIQIYKIDAEKNRELAAAFGVNAYPTLFFIPMDDKPAGAKGLLPKEKLKEIIKTYLKVSKQDE